MKHTLVASVLILGISLGGSAIASPPPPSPLIGSWAVDTSRMPMPPEARPKSVLITFADAGKNHLTMAVDIIYADGSQVHSKGNNPLDGTAVAVAGSPETDSAAMEQPQPDVLVVGLSKAGVPASTRVYSAATDGKTMTEVVSFYDDQGKPAMRMHYFTRAR